MSLSYKTTKIEEQVLKVTPEAPPKVQEMTKIKLWTASEKHCLFGDLFFEFSSKLFQKGMRFFAQFFFRCDYVCFFLPLRRCLKSHVLNETFVGTIIIRNL